MNPAEQEQVEKSIEISIDAAERAVQKKAAVLKLFKMKEFKLIFEELYFKEEPARLVSLLTDPGFQDEDSQKNLHNDMIAISALRGFLMNIQKLGTQMEQAIASSQEQLEELRNEEE